MQNLTLKLAKSAFFKEIELIINSPNIFYSSCTFDKSYKDARIYQRQRCGKIVSIK